LRVNIRFRSIYRKYLKPKNLRSHTRRPCRWQGSSVFPLYLQYTKRHITQLRSIFAAFSATWVIWGLEQEFRGPGRVHLGSVKMVEKVCPQCGVAFECRQEAGCWCAEQPWKVPVPEDRSDPAKGCLCPDCLRAVLGLKTEQLGR